MEKRIVELFAGVGGFRLGFEQSAPEWNTVFMSQWEPGKKNQFAFDCYKAHFDDDTSIFSNENISDVMDIPDHEILVGGFPCQDYSVASTCASGIVGKKGVLWWEIKRIVDEKRPPFILLENVDRLLKSPSSQRGRDFGIILACLNNMGYGVEWRVINAAEYGFVQRRKRVFIFAFKKDTKHYNELTKLNTTQIISYDGMFAKNFPISEVNDSDISTTVIGNDIKLVSTEFGFDFKNSGILLDGNIYTCKTHPKQQQNTTCINEILQKDVDEKYYINDEDIELWSYLKGSKSIPRKTKDGFEYIYKEGAVPFPDPIGKQARTILTGEGSRSRTSHAIMDPQTGRIRRLTPLECERINGFPDNWTNTGMSDSNRYFCMGNALVVGIIEKIATGINNLI